MLNKFIIHNTFCILNQIRIVRITSHKTIKNNKLSIQDTSSSQYLFMDSFHFSELLIAM